jgi:hypothetical protein
MDGVDIGVERLFECDELMKAEVHSLFLGSRWMH